MKVLITTAVAVLIIALIIQFFLQSPYAQKTQDDQQKKINDLLKNVMQEIPQLASMEQVAEHNNSLYSNQNIGLLTSDIANVQVNSLQEEGHYTQLQTNVYQEMNMPTIDQYDQLNNLVKSLLMNESSEVAPVILRNFTKKGLEIEEFYSNPFFAFEEGYQMCLKVDKDGYADGEGTHVSVFLYLMKGPHDDKLEQSGHWPLRGTFTIELLNQLDDVTHIVQFHYHQCSGKCTNRVLEGVMADVGYGKTKFISRDTFLHQSESFAFRVSYEDSEPPYQVAPVTFKVTHFSQWLKSNQKWGSSPFFTFDGGYQMHLIISPEDRCEGTHVSVYLGLMKGPHDDKLEQSGHWPLRGTFTIELLNQFSDKDHYSRQVQLHHHLCSECTDRVLEGMMAYNGHGYAQFISHDALLHYTNNSYYVDDSLTFKISYEQMGPSNQVAPVIFNVTKFSQWLISKEKWYSNPFFAFSEGYQLCLQVYAYGYGDGEGTHVSVYLYVMKGPHDDKLEQSGHWPMRGTFTIELLNQRNDSDHYGHIVLFNNYLCSEYSNRIFEDMASMGCGYAKFISHDTLLYNDSSHYINNFLIFRVSYEHIEPPYQVMPVAFKLRNFSKLLKNKDEWYSSPFFAFSQGYQMCLKVFAAGSGIGEGTHVSVYLYLMKGPHDDNLEQSGHWPLRGTFTIELLNQLNDSDHYSIVQFHHHLCFECTNRVLVGAMANSGRGEPQFISHGRLFNSSNNYYKSDSLIFRISYEDSEPPYQVAPVIYKVTDFSKWLKNKEVWYSSPFFAFAEGYQMHLNVDASEGIQYISVYLDLTKGLYDDKLEQSGHWPLRGTFTIVLLNQLNGSDHYSCMVQFHHYWCSECTNRVLEEVMAFNGRGKSHFISYDTLLHHGYYSNDFLVFRVSYEHMEPPNQVTPVTFKVTKLSQWLKAKEEWYSSTFMAFEKGYQMFFQVYAFGTGDGEGTHVSVYLYLMKGPHDDQLEQSGHWPMRGTFTIELLNQLNDSDHYSRMVQFHHHLWSECTNRVLMGAMTNSGCGELEFISHDTLLHNNSNNYYKGDSLIFRISYEDSEPPYQVAPVTFKVTHFSRWLKSKEVWYSSPFFAFVEGYQMHLKVYSINNSQVSVYLDLTKGAYDDKLEQSGHWPLRGTFTIELLNQLNDSDHYSRMVQFHHYWCSECTNRVLAGVIANSGRGESHFISYSTLLHRGYYRNDSLIFRISYEHMEPPNQVTPVTFKVSKFSQWLKSKEEWDSSPFMVFKKGYQMFFRVYAFGDGDGEGTHVSVYLYLMKGPHDDKLEQSGHWPLRGTFTIELLSQLNHSDHYSRMVQFHHHLWSECTKRVLIGTKANSGCGEKNFISVDTLLHHNYYKDDSLIFRISYEDSEPPYQVAPVTFRITHFSQWLKSEEIWYSSPFFAFVEGYQMHLFS